jgi:protein-disulfide isomerase
MRNATTWFIVGFVVLIVIGLFVASIYSSGSGTAGNGFISTAAPAITSSDWKEGNVNAKVTVIEYGDFECPACGEYFPVMQQLLGNFSSTVEFVFRNFPLYQIHPDAGIGAQAAEAAGLMGGQTKYWAMHDLLYTNQNDWSTISPDQVVSQKLDGYAQSLGLDVNTFNKDISSSDVLNKIQTDVNGGNTAQIDHTPTFFINLQQIQNPTNYADFANTVTQAVAAAQASSTATSPPATSPK